MELPADYVKTNVELGYASTVHRSQGMTVEESFFLPSPKMDRQGLYVGLTRGKTLNRIYIADDEIPDLDDHSPQQQPPSAREVVESILDRDGRSLTARAILAQADQPADLETLSLVYDELNDHLIYDHVTHTAKHAGLDQAAELLRQDWQTPRLGAALSAIEQQHPGDTTLLSEAIERAWHRFEEDNADSTHDDWIVAREHHDDDSPASSLAFLVRMELTNAIGDTPSPALSGEDLWAVSGLAKPLTHHNSMDPEVHQAMVYAAEQISQRLDTAADQAVATHPEWVHAIGEYRPKDEDYHEKWTHAVRLIAAGREIGDTDALSIAEKNPPEQSVYHHAMHAVRYEQQRSSHTRYASMGRSELERFLRHCDDKASLADQEARTWEMRASSLDQLRAHEEKVRAERVACVKKAEQGVPILQARKMLSDREKQVYAAQAQLHAAHREGFFTRGKKVKDATSHLEAVIAARDKETEFYHSLRESSPVAIEELEKATALASNEGQWARRFQQAYAKDQELVDTAARNARRLRMDEGLWQQRSRKIADKLEESRPLTHKEAQVYIQHIKDTLNRKLPKGAATDIDGANPYSLDAADDLKTQLAQQHAQPRSTTPHTPTHHHTYEHRTHNDMEL
ncbi:C-terminal helicase domain-containing protein [Corynebacterium mastitidis]|uniref:C-terminal helicase domain-containing protein n=1 Tax=Corynebacterium mastitidis TaxID=161890 RepID=UPI002549EF96|nr:helicase C-terminal domain-containing protein [Corynebacterium mastitidis]MDK8451480.1 helicase C-terminal domain-containing protein [Corynebacterium mastitidis]